MRPDPEACLNGCLSGDPAAWASFCEGTAGVIHAAVRKAAGDGTTVRAIEDTVQDVFVRLLKDDCRLLRTFDPSRARLTTWITLIARSVAIDQLRKREVRAVGLEDASVMPDGRENPAAADPHTIQIPENVFEELTGRQRLVIRLLFDEARSVPETAAMLGVNEQTIRSTKHKALIRLRGLLAGSDDASDENNDEAGGDGDADAGSPVSPARSPAHD